MSVHKDYIPAPSERFYLLNTDSSPYLRPYSPTLPARRFVHVSNNQIAGNRPVGVGYEFSTVGLSCRKPMYGISEPPWNLPLSMRLIPYGENKNKFTAQQVNDILDNEDLPMFNSLTVNTLDSGYASPEYIANTHDQQDLVNIIRLPSNRNVWKQLSKEEQQERRKDYKKNKGTNAIYGEKYKLNEFEEWDFPCDEEIRFGIKLANGKCCIVHVMAWNDMLVRSQRGTYMKDKPFRLLRIRLLDAKTGEPLFKKTMWLGVWGERRNEITLEEGYWSYRGRYDIEHFFRYGKQKLLLDKFQTPDEEHLQNWLEIVRSAYWLLWVGQKQAGHDCRKWQQYDKNYKNREQHNLKVTPSQVQLQLAAIILGSEQTLFLPKPQINGKGRQLGGVQEKRPVYPILKKKKKRKRRKKKRL